MGCDAEREREREGENVLAFSSTRFIKNKSLWGLSMFPSSDGEVMGDPTLLVPLERAHVPYRTFSEIG
jgi:hypothetical protein